MLDDVAIYIVVAPMVLTMVMVGVIAAWLTRRHAAGASVTRRERVDSE
jgi:hypothetical protein